MYKTTHQSQVTLELPFLIALLVICQKSHEPSFMEMTESLVDRISCLQTKELVFPNYDNSTSC